MVGYVTIGTNNLARAAGFYDPIAQELGGGRAMEMDKFIAWESTGSPMIGAITPFDGKPATPAIAP